MCAINFYLPSKKKKRGKVMSLSGEVSVESSFFFSSFPWTSCTVPAPYIYFFFAINLVQPSRELMLN